MIGVFDSGVGGLTALWELRRLRPDLDIVYFGDTAHVPYGTRSPEMIRRFAGEAVGFLSGLGAEAILVACGTVSSVALPALSEHTGCPLFGVVEPAAEVAYRVSKNKKIGILATEATVGSGAFDRALRRLGPRRNPEPRLSPVCLPRRERLHRPGRPRSACCGGTLPCPAPRERTRYPDSRLYAFPASRGTYPPCPARRPPHRRGRSRRRGARRRDPPCRAWGTRGVRQRCTRTF